MEIERINELINKGLLLKTENLDLRKNHGLYIKIGVVSETIGFLISRNNEPTELTSENFYNDERGLVPGQKWRAAERGYLLSELRKVDGIIPKDYARNMTKYNKYLKNPVSLLYGDTSIGSDNTGIASRTFYDWGYTYEPLGLISTRLLHNTLSDDGTILHEENGDVKSNAIYNTEYIKPGVKFIRFISLENASLELLELNLIATLGCSRYGARTAILGDNIRNNIIGIGFSKGDMPISSYSLLEESWKNGNYDPEKQVLESMRNSYGDNLISGRDLDELLKNVLQLRENKDELKNICNVIVATMDRDWKDLWKDK